MPSDTNQPETTDRAETTRPRMDKIKSPAADEQPPVQQAEVGAKANTTTKRRLAARHEWRCERGSARLLLNVTKRTWTLTRWAWQ